MSSAISKGDRRLTEGGDVTRAPAKERRSALSERTLRGAHRRGLVTTAPTPKTGAGGDASGACPNWAAITTSPGKATSRYPAGQDRLDPSGNQGPSHQRAAASLRHRIFGSRLCVSPGRGADKAQAGLIVGRVTQVVPGASLRAHVSLSSRKKPPLVEISSDSPQPVPPSATQEAAPSLPVTKDNLAVTAERYQDVLPLPSASMLIVWVGLPKTI